MKTCKRCGTPQPLAEFYAHPAMSDGHLSVCKTCVRARVKERENRLRSTSLQWVTAERERCRLKQARRRESGACILDDEKARECHRRWGGMNSHKRRAHCAVSRAIKSGTIVRNPCEVCGDVRSEAHHEDYSRPLHVIWLCDTHHKEAHVRMREASARLRLGQEKSVIQLNLYA